MPLSPLPTGWLSLIADKIAVVAQVERWSTRPSSAADGPGDLSQFISLTPTYFPAELYSAIQKRCVRCLSESVILGWSCYRVGLTGFLHKPCMLWAGSIVRIFPAPVTAPAENGRMSLSHTYPPDLMHQVESFESISSTLLCHVKAHAWI